MFPNSLLLATYSDFLARHLKWSHLFVIPSALNRLGRLDWSLLFSDVCVCLFVHSIALRMEESVCWRMDCQISTAKEFYLTGWVAHTFRFSFSSYKNLSLPDSIRLPVQHSMHIIILTTKKTKKNYEAAKDNFKIHIKTL